MDPAAGRKKAWSFSSASKKNGTLLQANNESQDEVPEGRVQWRVSQAAVQARRLSIAPQSNTMEEESTKDKQATIPESDSDHISRATSLSTPQTSRKPSLAVPAPALRKGSDARWSRYSEMSKMSGMSDSSYPLDIPDFPPTPGEAPLDFGPTTPTSPTDDDPVLDKRASRSNVKRPSMVAAPSFKTDFDVPVVLDPTIDNEKRTSRQASLTAQFSEMEKAEREKERRRFPRMSTLSDHNVNLENSDRRNSKRLSVFSDNSGDVALTKRESKRFSIVSPSEVYADPAERELARRSRADWAQPVEVQHEEVEDWRKDTENAHNWRLQTKIFNTLMISFSAFTTSFAATIYAPAHEQVMDKFDTSSILSILPYSLFIFGLAFGPVISGPSSDALGRKAVYLAATPIAGLFILGCGLSHMISVLAVCRCLAGVFASVAFFLGMEMISDIWTPSYQMLPVALYLLSLSLGLPVGTLIGGVVTEHIGWRWTQWITLLFIFVGLLPALVMTESHKSTILRRRENKVWAEEKVAAIMSESTEDEDPVKKPTNFPRDSKAALYTMVMIPIRLIIAEPVTFLLGIGVALGYAILSAFFVIIPQQFGAVYGFQLEGQGLTFAGMCVALVVAFVVVVALNQLFYEPRYARWAEAHPAVVEEEIDEKVDEENRKTYVTAATRRASLAEIAVKASARNSRKSIGGTRNGLNELSEEEDVPALPTNHGLNIATAVCAYLKTNPKNANKIINPGRIITTINTLPKYGDIASTLENMDYSLDRTELAKTIADALNNIVEFEQPPVARSRSLHLAAAEAMLLGDSAELMPPLHYDEKKTVLESDPSALDSSLLPRTSATASSNGSITKLVNKHRSNASGPPAEWRLVPALPASILAPAGLFLFAWTFETSIHWIVPVIGMSIFAASAMLTFVSGLAYTNERFAPAQNADEEEREVAGRLATGARAGGTMLVCALSAAFSLFSQPMYIALGVSVATTVFGAVMAAAGVVPWFVVFMGKKRRDNSSVELS